MENKLVDKLALIYVQAHTGAATTPAQIYAMYKKAVNEIRTAEREDYSQTT